MRRDKRARSTAMAVVAFAMVTASPAILAQQGVRPVIPLSTDTLPLGAKIKTLKYLGDLNDDLTFTPVTPCRLVDTRDAVAGALSPRAARAFSATSNSLIAAAGGNVGGCEIPAGPTALALTITAVLPTQVGNLVAYAEGMAIPLSSALNFLAGQIIANTSVVPSSSTVGPNFALYNNSDGPTHVVVDIVGYFYAPEAPDCVTVMGTVGPDSGASFSVTATCSAGYRLNLGGCATTATAIGTDWQMATISPTNDGWLCAGKNNTGGAATITSQAYCCRKVGR